MFTCSACLRRALKNIEPDLTLDTSFTLFSSGTNIVRTSSSLQHKKGSQRITPNQKPFSPIHRRSHATLASLKKGHHRQQLQFLRDGSKAKNSPLARTRRKAPWTLTKVELRDAVSRDRNRTRMREESGEIEDVEGEMDNDVLNPAGSQESSNQTDSSTSRNEMRYRDPEKEERRLMRRDEKQIEVYYKDPLQLADGVLQRLRVPDIEGALRLVRASQAFELKNVVSWNHCCDWLMAHGQIKQALSVYNEMKKRGQKPDAHSYTIMLRGLSQHVERPNAVREAVKIYNSIFAPNSAVKPNTIHTNAIINVCARGGDMDSLWAVAGRLPDRGPGSPDRITFSTILNAIRENTIKEVAQSADKVQTSKNTEDKSEDDAAEERSKLYAKAVEDGRKLWEDISHRWRRADLVIDEQLVCAMGRLLLTCGLSRDVEQILDLVEVTMNLRLKERVKGKHRVQWLEAPASQSSGFSPIDQTGEEGYESRLPLKESNVYATPGPNTLSMLLEACSQVRLIQHYSTPYWRKLTDLEGPYKVKPDAANVMVYLRLLRMQRASSDSYKLLAQDWPEDVTRVLYRRASFIIAFSTCMRDKRNPNVFQTAQKLLKLAEEKADQRAMKDFDKNISLGEMKYHKRKQVLQDTKKSVAEMTAEEKDEMARNREGVQSLNIDPKILNYFVELAVVTTDGWNEGLRGKDDGTIFERHPSKNHTMMALMTVASRTKDLKRLVKAKMEEIQNRDMPRRRKERALDPRAGSRVGENLEDLLQLMKTMIGAWDKCLDVHERFEKAGRPGLDEHLMEGFFDRKREMTSYMARVEKEMGMKLRQQEDFETEKEQDEDNEEIEDEDDSKPDIERRINAVLQGVNANLIKTRMETKNSKSKTMRRYGDAENMKLTLSSRRQKTERDNLIKEGMSKTFPKENFGALDSDLQVVPDKEVADVQREEQKRRLKQGFAKGLSSRNATRPFSNTGVKRTKERISTEDQSRTRSSGTVDWKNMNQSKQMKSAILDRPDVRSAWERSILGN